MDEGGAVAVVRAFYETSAAGEDPSVHLAGPLADAVRIQVAATRGAVIAARSFVARRIVLVREHGAEALVAVDGEHRLAYQSNGEWKPHVERVHGLARALRTDDGWRVTDLPSGKLSALRSVGVVGPTERDGDLDFELVVTEAPKRSLFHVVLRNHGERALTVSRIELEQRLFRRLPFIPAVPFTQAIVIEPGGSFGFRFGDQHPYWWSRGTVRFEARDAAGRTHTVERTYGPAVRPEPAIRRGRVISQSRLFEAGAILSVFLSPWWLATLVTGGLLLVASITRLPPLLHMLRHGGRGVGLQLATTFATAEFLAGTAVIFYDDLSWTAVALWVTLVSIAYPVVRQIFAARPQE